MRAGDFAGALAALQARTSKDSECLYLSAVCLRYLKNPKAALQQLHQLHQRFPDHSRALQEEGHVYRAMGDGERALAAYSRATRLNSALNASWQAQIDILSAQGRQNQANNARQQLRQVQKLPKILVSVTDLLAQGKIVKAEKICRAFLQKNPLNTDAMSLLAEIGVKLGVLEDAEFLLQTATELKPRDAKLQMELLQVLRKRQKFELSRACAKNLLDGAPSNPQFQSLYAIECMQTGDYDTALALFDQVLSSLPEEPATLTSRGHALKTYGQQEAAIDSYGRALTAKPSHGEAWYSLANLKTFNFSSRQVADMKGLLDTAYLSHDDRVYLNFALGKALEDQKHYAESFAHYKAGNELKKAQSRYTSSKMEQEFQQQHVHCNAALVKHIEAKGDKSPAPIFIVGLPRAGSTLLEQILSSHSQVDGTLELPNIPALAHKLRAGSGPPNAREHRYPQILHHLGAEQLAGFGADYIRDTQIHRQGAAFFIDKMPNNFRHIGLIKAILPNAKIIDARRQPMSCCFSGYKQLFAEGQEFTYDLADVGHYYTGYTKLMTHWHNLFPGQILQVDYENVVEDITTQVARILEYCNLPQEQACIDFYQNKRAVRTPSSEQVRQPLFRSGLDQWQHFDSWLAPLRKALDPGSTS